MMGSVEIYSPLPAAAAVFLLIVIAGDCDARRHCRGRSSMTITTSFQPQNHGRTTVMVLRGGGDDSNNNLEISEMMNVHPVDHDAVLDENATTGHEKRKKPKFQKHKKKRRKHNHTKDASFMSSSSSLSPSLMPLEGKDDDGDDGKSQRLIKGENCSEDSISTSISNVTNDQGQDQCIMKSSTTAVRHDKLQNAKHPTTSMSLRSKKDKHPRVGKQGECLRRIKREWKDAVKLGIAYDWKTKETVTSKGRSPSGMMDDWTDSTSTSTSTNSNSTFFQYNYVRMGPFGKNLLRWHFSVLGPSNSPYSEGIYHGRILLPKNYPMSPPRVQMLTPSGRFVPGEDICLSASNYHPETWTPRWTILSLIDALRLHMLTTPNEIGGIDSTREKRMDLAVQSRRWKSGPIDHGQMVQNGIFCEKIMLKEQQEQQQEEDDEEGVVLLGETNKSSSSLLDYCNVLELERTLESSHGNKQAFYTHHGKHIKRRKRTFVQQIILCSINMFVEVCKNPYFQLLIVFLALSQYLLHHGYS
jgi:Ubiquitin-protein ligase